MTPRIEIDDVTKYYGQTLVLDAVSLSVAAHEVVCLIGASGSGKSTLLRCINRLVEFDHGEIRLDGVSSKMRVSARPACKSASASSSSPTTCSPP
jgi:polar amino acid transport system ATP-binding protein